MAGSRGTPVRLLCVIRTPVGLVPHRTGWICRLTFHTKPASSRTIAVMTFGCGLQAAESRRYRWHSLACAFQPIALISSGRCSTRILYRRSSRAGSR